MTRLALWAGPECTVNRVGDVFRDQADETGFAGRCDDLDRIAALGVRTVRLPLLWERVAAHGPAGWTWIDERLARAQDLGLECIGGLVHHGSGPPGVDLLHPGFAAGLADHARALAQRHPALRLYTPVNEPLTTARFAALYGLWYPHRRDDRSFVQALLNQVRATVLAMRAIREVRPDAVLVQTEDLGFTHATRPLRYQADFENHRRWLTFDLLCGRVDCTHALWDYLIGHGADASLLSGLVADPCPPGIVGINHYVTSERFLDHRLDLYPDRLHGGNGRDRYVDVEAVRAHGPHLDGVAARLMEAWQRHGLPLAVTECHLGCTREEQMRWLQQVWQAAQQARDAGADVRAVTAWSVFGAMDWNSLITQRSGHYEPGLWDVRAALPRPTALARMARQLAAGEAPAHPVLTGRGWWQRSLRHTVPPHGALQAVPSQGRPVLITGGTGTLGRAFARMCHLRGLGFRLTTRTELDICDPRAIEAALASSNAWAVINAAGFVRVDDAEHESRQWRENVEGPSTLAQVCSAHGVPLLTFSSDLVFDGTKAQPYVESDAPRPLCAYGEAKVRAEERVLAQAPAALVVRTAAFFGPWDRHNFVTVGLGQLGRGGAWHASADQVVSPTYVRDLVMTALDLLIDGEQGLWHLTNGGAVSWYELARRAAVVAGLDVGQIVPVKGALAWQVARRPGYAALGSERGRLMPPLDDALARYWVERAPDDLPGAERVQGDRPAADLITTPSRNRRGLPLLQP